MSGLLAMQTDGRYNTPHQFLSDAVFPLYFKSGCQPYVFGFFFDEIRSCFDLIAFALCGWSGHTNGSSIIICEPCVSIVYDVLGLLKLISSQPIISLSLVSGKVPAYPIIYVGVA